MNSLITRVEIQHEQDVVYARQRARLIAELLGFDRNDQTRISTSVSEIARNAFQYAGGGEVRFMVEGEPPSQILAITVWDRGMGIDRLEQILEGRFSSPTGMGLGITGARRLVDHFHIETQAGQGTTVFLGMTLPVTAAPATAGVLARIAETLVQTRAQNPLEEVRLQNQELLQALEELRQRQEELSRLNRELDDTNRGVLALYAELDEKAEHLKRANELKGRFLSNMSHELRTPLNSILALSRLLLDRVDGELSEEQEKQVVFIRKAAEDLSALVNDLLDLAKIEAGKITVHPRECTVAEIFSGLRGMLKPLLISESVELVFEEPLDVPPLFTDDGKVSQILRNFLSNALKFTERGEVRVAAKSTEDGNAVVFSVADTGIGIAPEQQERIFQEYVQVEASQPSRAKGTGLGLPISLKLAEMLGGTIGVGSQPGVGSNFSATIPIRYAEGDRLPEVDKPLVEDATRLPVLVVEDDPATQLLYEKFLKGTGFKSVPAQTIREARRILSAVKPVAILLDILMPGEDSWKFLADIKSDQTTREVPVIIASVLDEQDKGMALGVEDYCVKPVERKWLMNRLKALSATIPIQKVLIIDDEEVARYILRGYLADTRYQVIEASSGLEGLRAVEREKPDIIFLDLVMPGMSGFEVLAELKQNPATRHLPVVVVTSMVLEAHERDELNARAVAVLSKAISSREQAMEKVREALKQAISG